MENEPDTSKRAIGERMMIVRMTRGWSGVLLAEAMGISPQRLNNYETGKTFPPPDILAKFWRVTGATSDYVLFNRRDGMPYDLVRKVQEVEGNLAKERPARITVHRPAPRSA